MNIYLKVLFSFIICCVYSCSPEQIDEEMETETTEEETDNPEDSEDESVVLSGTILYQNDTIGNHSDLDIDLNSDGENDFYFFKFYASTGTHSYKALVLDCSTTQEAYLNLDVFEDTIYKQLDTVVTFATSAGPPIGILSRYTQSCYKLTGEELTVRTYERTKLIYKDINDNIPSDDHLWSNKTFEFPFEYGYFNEGEGHAISGDTIWSARTQYEVDCYTPPLDTKVYFHIMLKVEEETFLARVTFERTSNDDLIFHEVFLFD